MNDLINQLFANLDNWRHFPNYQLERRADIFFSIYLRDFLTVERGYDVQSIIPEFPIRIGTIYPNQSEVNKSKKADYLVKLRNPNRILLIELKTDSRSRRPEQDDYLVRAQDVTLHSLLDGLKSIYHATTSSGKYKHLLRALDKAGLINNLRDNDFDIVDSEHPISIIYLQPNGNGDNIINFLQLAEFVGKKQDDLSKRFSESLKVWATNPAGANGT